MSQPGLWMKWAKVWAAGGAIVGAGVLLFEYTVPTKEQLIEQLSPELREQYERERELRQAEQRELMKIVQQTMKSNDPIWKTGSIRSPWERDAFVEDKGDSNNDQPQQQQLVQQQDHFNEFHKIRSDQKQKDNLEKISQELEQIRIKSEERTREILEERRKNAPWYKFW